MRTSARERVLINAAKTEAQMRSEMAKREEQARTEPIAGAVAGYDAVTKNLGLKPRPSGRLFLQPINPQLY